MYRPGPSPRGAPPFLAALLLAGAALPGAALPCAAQAVGAIEGLVVDQDTGALIGEASITIHGSNLQARSGADGHFFITEVPAGTTLLRVNADGYSGIVEEVQVQAGDVARLEIRLMNLSALLDEVLVTGTRGRGGTVHTMGEEVRTAADMLSRRIPGMGISAYGGEIGARERILLRGVSSLSLGNEPAIYLDGVRIFGGGDGAQDMTQVIQLLNAIPAANVRRMDILRGPSASVAFGELATGVIVIETR